MFRILTLFVLSACLLSWPVLLAGQEKQKERDTEMEAKIDQGWKEIRMYWEKIGNEEGDATVDPQIALAPDFFSYYLEHPNTATGKDAAKTAFILWGNLGATAQVKKATENLADDSPLWGEILDSVSTAYFKDDRAEEFHELLIQLENRLVEDRSRSKLLLRLGESLARKDLGQQAKVRFNSVIEIAASQRHVERAERSVYELEMLNIGQLAPDFSSDTIDGKTIRLSELRGKVVLLEFWATTCGPCVKEIPQLTQLYGNVDANEFQLLGITNDHNQETIVQFVKKAGNNWPQIHQPRMDLDGRPVNGEIMNAYNVSSLPRYFLIDRNGKIAFKDLRGDDLSAAVESMVNENRQPNPLR